MQKYNVELTSEELTELCNLCSKGQNSARKIRKVNILIEAAAGRTDDEIAQNLKVGYATIQRTRRRFVEGNLQHALTDCPRDGRPKKFDGIQEAALIALACTTPPEGCCIWTTELLAEQMVFLGVVDKISSESVRIMGNKNDLKPWQKQEWCIPKIDAEYVWRMETVHFPNADKIHVVLDNLNTHSPSTLYEILSPQEARDVVRRLEFHYTPKHASWLNMAEIEFAALRKQCLNNRYISNIGLLEKEVSAWKNRRNSLKTKVEWMFAIEDARNKMGHLYPKLLKTIAHHIEQAQSG